MKHFSNDRAFVKNLESPDDHHSDSHSWEQNWSHELFTAALEIAKNRNRIELSLV